MALCDDQSWSVHRKKRTVPSLGVNRSRISSAWNKLRLVVPSVLHEEKLSVGGSHEVCPVNVISFDDSERLHTHKNSLSEGIDEHRASDIFKPQKKTKLNYEAEKCNLGCVNLGLVVPSVFHEEKLSIGGSHEVCPVNVISSDDESERLHTHKNSLNGGYEVGDEGSEANKIRLATTAIKEYNEFMGTKLEVVKVGCLAAGAGSIPECRIVHMNFEAKNIDDHGARVLTFFAELVLMNNDVSSVFLRPLGPTDSLPAKADIGGCLYCHRGGIHHPNAYGFHNGRESLYPILLQKIQMAQQVNDAGVDQKSIEPLEDRCATLALDKYNKEEGMNFELMETDDLGGVAHIAPGLIIHLNFQAKNRDDPHASVQTFFAEAIQCSPSDLIVVIFCKCLGPTDLLPDEADMRGCSYCCDGTYHPPCTGYVIGREKLQDYH